MDLVSVAIFVEDELKALVEALVDCPLAQSLTLFLRRSRHIHHEVGEGVFKDHTLSDSAGLFCNFENPLTLFLSVGGKLAELNHPIPVSMEDAVRRFLFSDDKGVGVFGVFYLFDPEQLPTVPVAEGEFDLFDHIVKDKGREGMNQLIQVFFLDEFDHPHLVEIAAIRDCHHGAAVGVGRPLELILHRQHLPRSHVGQLVVVAGPELDLLSYLPLHAVKIL